MTPYYTVKTEKAVLKPKYNSVAAKIFKRGILLVILILIISSIFFRENMFAELSFSSRFADSSSHNFNRNL